MTKQMNLDLLTELVMLEECHRLPDGQGGMTTEWRPVETLWACIQAQKPTPTTERWQGERPHYAARYWVWLRRAHVLPATYRLRWHTHILVPLSAVSRLPGQEWQMMLTEEEVLQ
ncbi:MAG: head-tail adaptor protein [Alphaproteobacteria bacterium]